MRAALCLLGLSLLFTPAVSAVEQLNAVQIGMLDAADAEQLRKEFTALRAAAIDTVIVRAIHNPGARLDPFYPEALRRPGALYGDLAEYDLDGILFQEDLALMLSHESKMIDG